MPSMPKDGLNTQAVRDEFNIETVSVLRRTLLDYQKRLLEADAVIDRTNSDEYNDLKKELKYFDELTAGMLDAPDREITAAMAGKLKDSLDAVHVRAARYADAKKDSFMGVFRRTRKKRFTLAVELSLYISRLKEYGINAENANELPREQERFYGVKKELPLQSVKRTEEDLKSYLDEVDTRSLFSFCGNENDTHHLTFLQEMNRRLTIDLAGYLNEKEFDLGDKFDADKDPTVMRLRSKNLLLLGGIGLREAMAALAENPGDRGLQARRDLCMVRLSLMMAYARKVGWEKMQPQELEKIADASLDDLRREVKNPSLDLLFDPPDRLGKEEIIKYRVQGMSSGQLMEEVRFSYDGGKYTCKVPMNREARLKSVLELNSVKQMLASYDRSVEYWLASPVSLLEEAESHRAFVTAHRAELDRIYGILHSAGKLDPAQQEKLTALLGEKNLDQLMSDYCCLTGKGEADPVCQMLGLHKKENQSDFADIMRSVAIPRPDDPAYAAQKADLDLTGRLAEFHKWMYRNSESAAGNVTENYLGGEGSARPFVEEFIRQDPMIQLKTLYVMEHKLRRADISRLKDEDLRAYVPDLTKLKDEMVASKLFFWKRLSGNKHRWDKLRDCLKNVRDNEIGRHLETASGAVPAFTQSSNLNTLRTNLTTAIKGTASGDRYMKDVFKTAFSGSDPNVNLSTRASSITKVAFMGIDGAFFVIDGANLIMSIRKDAYVKSAEELLRKVDPAKLGKEQRELFDVLTKHTRSAKINDSYETKKRIVNFFGSTAAFLGDAAVVTVVAPWAAAAIAAGVPIYLVVNNKLNAAENRKVVDSEIYRDEADKQNRMEELQDNLENRFYLKGERFRESFRKKFNGIKNNADKLSASLREKVMAKSGFVNLEEFKNYLTGRIGDDVYDGLNKLKKSEFRIYNDKTGEQKDFKTETLSKEELDNTYRYSSEDEKFFRAYLEEICSSLFKGLGTDGGFITGFGLEYKDMQSRAQKAKERDAAHESAVQLAHGESHTPVYVKNVPIN